MQCYCSVTAQRQIQSTYNYKTFYVYCNTTISWSHMSLSIGTRVTQCCVLVYSICRNLHLKKPISPDKAAYYIPYRSPVKSG